MYWLFLSILGAIAYEGVLRSRRMHHRLRRELQRGGNRHVAWFAIQGM